MEKINKTVVFYFSGTGNARRVAIWIAEYAANNNIDCKIFNIAKTDRNTIDTVDSNTLVIIISPVHGFNFPKITLDFIRHFPEGKNRIVLMNTRGGMKIGRYVTPGLTGIGFMLSSLILIAKGYRVVGQIPFDMPSNWISIHPALNENTVEFLHKKNQERVEKHCRKIFSGQTDFFAWRDVIQDILISPVALAYYFIGRFALAKSFYASADCDNCGLCIKQCPAHAIKMVKEHPYWTFDCESCMKCMNTCPRKAIETAHGLFVIIGLVSSAFMTLILLRFINPVIHNGIGRIIISSLIFLVLVWGFYIIQHLLLRIKLIGKVISFTSLTHYKFWGRYRSIADHKWKKQ